MIFGKIFRLDKHGRSEIRIPKKIRTDNLEPNFECKILLKFGTFL